MTEALSRAELIRTGKAREYIRKRKKYFAEEVYRDIFPYDGALHTHYVDRQTNEVCWNDIPRNEAYFGLSMDEIRECERIREAVKKQVMRLKHHLLFLLAQPDYECFFVTLTLTDDILLTTSAETRKQRVRRALSQVTEDFIANIDFAPETEREHFHGVIAVLPGMVKKEGKHYKFTELEKAYGYGNINIEPIRQTKKSIKAVPRYIDKLALHACKEHQTSIITKRGTRYRSYRDDMGGVTGLDIKALQSLVFAKWKNGDENETFSKLLHLFGAYLDYEEE